MTRAAAWSVPVIAVATSAPAFAASCQPITGATMPIPASGTISNGGRDYALTYNPPANQYSDPVTMTIKAAYTGRMAPGSESQGVDLYTTFNPVGGLRTRGLGLVQTVTGSYAAPGRSARGVYTFSFTKPVTNLRFTLTDIDVLDGDYDDRIEISNSGWTEVRASRGAGVSGTGVQGDPWRGAGTYNDNTSSAGNVTIAFAGPVSTFDLTYWNAMTSFSGVDRNQGVFLTNISFDYQPC
ncbi:hypothetical protein GCM10009797_08450 [Nocardioides hwasunensis]